MMICAIFRPVGKFLFYFILDANSARLSLSENTEKVQKLIAYRYLHPWVTWSRGFLVQAAEKFGRRKPASRKAFRSSPKNT